MLEKRINIRASDYKFEDKKKYYKGFEKQGKKKEGTKNKVLLIMAEHHNNFTEADIIDRNNKILNGFIEYLNANNLLNE